jgi:hypothetical protein
VKLLVEAIARLQEKFPVNRVVVLLTPIAFVPASAWVAGYLARNLPGLPAFSSAQILAFMITGAGSALAVAYKWLANWREHEGHLAGLASIREEAAAKEPPDLTADLIRQGHRPTIDSDGAVRFPELEEGPVLTPEEAPLPQGIPAQGPVPEAAFPPAPVAPQVSPPIVPPQAPPTSP